MPSRGFNARFAIPVLNDLDVMSTIAAPVVSEPVPAVVGTGRRIKIDSQVKEDVGHTGNQGSQFFLDREVLPNRCIHEVE